ncbi:YlaH-like family protein [Virgibacillus sp. NKC19-16]|uniref:YlaH-like family protein n=1 Tax=Virgibacillus salidurans TaxID=2831673 RepID=UPI001F2E73A7|nr:YlaH-like family protein [Virgibacillus sp. NKC19-16]UJL47813.1 YlaH-like family protein [Virgibacillus sp. NKC19-16]
MDATNFSPIFDFVLNNFPDNVFWIFYVLNLIFGAIAFKLGFARKLPLLKTIFVYIMLAVGTYIITIFSILQMPITESLIVISLVLAIYRFRLHRQRKGNQSHKKTPE